MYTLRGEELMFKLYEFVLNLIMMYNDNLYVSAAKFMTHRKEIRATITFFKGLGGITM